MKKLIIIAAMALTATGAYAQTKKTTKCECKFTYKVGIVTSLPFDAYGDANRATIGSTLGEASLKLFKKISINVNSGYLRFNDGEKTFSQVPVMFGPKYHINNEWYFGGSIGSSIPTKTDYGVTEFVYSPYVGYQQKKISVDLRYYVSGLNSNNLKTAMLVFSYQL